MTCPSLRSVPLSDPVALSDLSDCQSGPLRRTRRNRVDNRLDLLCCAHPQAPWINFLHKEGLHKEGQVEIFRRPMHFYYYTIDICCVIVPAKLMRFPRVKADGHGFYHCVSRVVEGRFIFQTSGHGSTEAEHFIKLMRCLEAFSGIRVLTYALMSNHFHLLCEVPEPKTLSEAEVVSARFVSPSLGRGLPSRNLWFSGRVPKMGPIGSCRLRRA